MQLLSLLNEPNQSFVTTQNGVRFEIRIIQCNGNMCCDVTMNGAVIQQGIRIVNGTPLVPFAWMTQGNGNFFFMCADEDCIDYSLFDVTQFLYYLSDAEITSIAAPPPATLTLTAAQQTEFNAGLTTGGVIPTGYAPIP